MTQNSNMTETPETEVATEKSSETRLYENIANNMDKFPTELSVTRNEVTKVFKPRIYGRGDKKTAGLKYVGPVEKVEVDNLESWIKFFGIEKVCSILNNAITAIAIATSERSVGDDDEEGTFQQDILVKGLTEFSSAGETIKELNERLAAANTDFVEWQKEYTQHPEYLNPSHPKNKEFTAQLQSISDEILYCQSNKAKRERPNMKGPRGPRKNTVNA